MTTSSIHRSVACLLAALAFIGASASTVRAADQPGYFQRVIQSVRDSAVSGERTQQTTASVAAVRG